MSTAQYLQFLLDLTEAVGAMADEGQGTIKELFITASVDAGAPSDLSGRWHGFERSGRRRPCRALTSPNRPSDVSESRIYAIGSISIAR